jgi:hypothetical protein
MFITLVSLYRYIMMHGQQNIKHKITDLTGGLTFYFEGHEKLYISWALNVKCNIVRGNIITSRKDNAHTVKSVFNVFNKLIAGR